ncbi:MAG: MarR family transcriptional regulator [Burkholderiales bacterium]|nr:MarR family transcriptional regulator [Burkholderiales bacterium]
MSSRHQVSTVFLRLGKAYNAATQAFESLTGVGAARWRLLYLIYQQPLTSQKHLIHQVRVDPGSITRQLKALEAEGLIARSDDPQDTRLTRVRLTRSGQSLVRRVMRQRAGFLAGMVSGLPRSEVHTCLKVLEGISRNLGDDEPLPPPRSTARTAPTSANKRAPRARKTA